MFKKVQLYYAINVLFILFAVVVLINNPANFYELSIFSSTPIEYWIAISFSILLSIMSHFLYDKYKSISLLILFIAIMTIIWLPVLRSYYFFDEYDSLSILGMIKDLMHSKIKAYDIFYPGIHILSIYIHYFTGISLKNSLLFVSLFFTIPFVIFTGLITRILYPINYSFNLGVIFALIFIPLNPLNVLLAPHPSSQAIFYSMVPLYIFILHIKNNNYKTGILYLLSNTMLYFIHPQQILNILFFETIIILCLVINDYFKNGTFKNILFPIYTLIASFLLIILLLLPHQIFEKFFRFIIFSLINSISSEGISGRINTLKILKIDIIELFIKLYLKIVIIIIGIIIALRYWYISKEGLTLYYILAIFPMSIITIVLLIVGAGNQLVRYIAFISALLTIIGAGGYSQFLNSNHQNILKKKIWLIIIILLGFSCSIPTFFPNPYVLRPNIHVTKGQYVGFNTIFSYAYNDIGFLRIRSSPFRYYDAIFGMGRVNNQSHLLLDDIMGEAPDHFIHILKKYNEVCYLPITKADIMRDTILFKGFRYDIADFIRLNYEIQIDKIYANSHISLYYVQSAG